MVFEENLKESWGFAREHWVHVKLFVFSGQFCVLRCSFH